MPQTHPKHRSLYLDEYTGKWQLRQVRAKSKHRCPVAWCKNAPVYRLRNGRIYISLYCYKCESRKKRANNPIRYAFECLKDSAKKRSIAFNISFSDFQAWCEETGYATNKGVARLTHHCDRIRHKEGYQIDNIQVLTQGENIRKRNRDIQQSLQAEENDDPF